MRPPLRIAVLECDTPLPETKARYGGYGGVFEALLKAGADALGQPDIISSSSGLDVTKWNVEHEEVYPDLDNIDAILLSGSKHNSFENVPWILKLVEFVKRVLAQDRVRIIGVCFGHQIVGRALGAKVDRSSVGWEVSVTPMSLTEKGRELFEKDDLDLQQMHKDIVYNLPEGTELLGYSPKCDVQGFYVRRRLITVQGHPEFTSQIVSEIAKSRHAQGIFDEAMYRDAISRVDNPHDGVAVSKAFLKFLLDD